MDKVKTIISKEWAEVFKNRMVLFTVAFLPLVFTALPLVMLYAFRDLGGGSADLGDEVPAQFASLCSEGLGGSECMQVFLATQFLLLFMMMPLIIPATFAAYSIVGEKAARSLEPLLATPITTAELLAGKSLAAVIPAVLATWGGFGLFLIGAWFLVSRPVFAHLLAPMWMGAIFVDGPLMAVMAVNVSIMISSRVNDPRVAEQLSMVVIIPVLGLLFGQIAGLILFNETLVLILAGVLIVIDVGLVYLGIQFFQRETILTRWR